MENQSLVLASGNIDTLPSRRGDSKLTAEVKALASGLTPGEWKKINPAVGKYSTVSSIIRTLKGRNEWPESVRLEKRRAEYYLIRAA